MDTTNTPPTQEDDVRTLREIVVAVFVAITVGVLVFLAIVGVISLINEGHTLNAVNQDTKATEHIAQEDHRLNTNADKFFKTIGTVVLDFEHNAYLACVYSGAQGCIPPRVPK